MRDTRKKKREEERTKKNKERRTLRKKKSQSCGNGKRYIRASVLCSANGPIDDRGLRLSVTPGTSEDIYFGQVFSSRRLSVGSNSTQTCLQTGSIRVRQTFCHCSRCYLIMRKRMNCKFELKYILLLLCVVACRHFSSSFFSCLLLLLAAWLSFISIFCFVFFS